MRTSGAPVSVACALLMAATFISRPTMGQERADSVGRHASAAPNAGISLVREAQKELQRVGCYEGELSGVWTPQSKSAARKFIDRMNARLPIEAPDDVLLALLRSQTGLVCNQCPSGQDFDAAGRCMPSALLKKPPANKPPPTSQPQDAVAQETAPREGQGAPPRAAESNSGAPPEPKQGRGPSPASKSWSSFIRKVDRALGLN